MIIRHRQWFGPQVFLSGRLNSCSFAALGPCPLDRAGLLKAHQAVLGPRWFPLMGFLFLLLREGGPLQVWLYCLFWAWRFERQVFPAGSTLFLHRRWIQGYTLWVCPTYNLAPFNFAPECREFAPIKFAPESRIGKSGTIKSFRASPSKRITKISQVSRITKKRSRYSARPCF